MMHFGEKLQAILLFFAIGRVASVEFNYCNQGYWIEDYGACGGRQQSPIELNIIDVPPVNNLTPLKFVNYDAPYNAPVNVVNNGHYVTIQLPQLTQVRNLPHITGGALFAAKFVPENVHFHLGSTNVHGSEHVINSRRFSMEMHVVHRNIKYPTLDEAIKYPDGLAAVGVMYDAVSAISESKPLSKITNVLKNIRNLDDSTTISNFNIMELIGNLKNQKIFTYPGSLTAPPCAEVVTWQVLSDANQMSYSQIDAFRALKDLFGNKLENNYRGLQAKNNRPVNIVNAIFTREILLAEN